MLGARSVHFCESFLRLWVFFEHGYLLKGGDEKPAYLLLTSAVRVQFWE